MNQIQLALQTLLKAIQESDEYLNFLDAKMELEKVPEKLRMANEFRAKSFQLQTEENQANLFDEMENLEKEYAVYIQDKIVKCYLQTEIELCGLIKEIDRTIVESLEIDVEFLM